MVKHHVSWLKPTGITFVCWAFGVERVSDETVTFRLYHARLRSRLEFRTSGVIYDISTFTIRVKSLGLDKYVVGALVRTWRSGSSSNGPHLGFGDLAFTV